MQWELKKFNKEIQNLRALVQGSNPDLDNTRADILKQKVLNSISVLDLKVDNKTYLKDKVFFNWPKFLGYATSILFGLSLLGGTAFASNSALPGDLLYPVKVRLDLAISEQSKAALQEKFAEVRLTELQEISVKSPPGDLKNKPDGHNAMVKPATTTLEIGQAISSGQPSSTPENQKFRQLQIQARQDADAAVASAVTALEKAKDNLESKGQEKAAASFNSNILELKIKAKEQGVYIPEDAKPQSQNQTSIPDNEATTTPQQEFFRDGHKEHKSNETDVHTIFNSSLK